ncbi:MAG: hypothetical protein ACYTEQ_26630 [Planctomycetota bacterium]|jgi:hypothetical protein
MSKVLSMRKVALQPGVKAEDYEKFVVEDVYPLPWPKGMKVYLLRGDRGDREDRYLVMYEFESVEARNRLFPSEDSQEDSKEWQEFMQAHKAVWEKGAPLAIGGGIYTDYVVIGE